MKYEDVVACVGESDATRQAAPQVHSQRLIDREDWACYMSEALQNVWRTVLIESDGLLLDKATYADWEDFCWRLTKKRAHSDYSRWLCEQDGL